ncbi:ethanolamine utilization protein [Cetobacterium sp. 8H]|uniref:ethanolamine utilization protein n=1 Tax=Cetobacterium sp. 8H TaxID=2759681 RepID=UPI00163B6AE3|nr:ethanolamine utilization protein [Cetobacterium sp. 8H]MBC2851703.1 ethanolamine utilization protein [Cetobacterium sp. 8H]
MVLTEEKLKMMYKQKKIDRLVIDEGTILTPSARQFLNERGIELVSEIGKSSSEIKEKESEKDNTQDIKIKYKGVNGEVYVDKPEYMTQIYGNVLVKKDNKRIVFRGKIDSLQAKWLVLSKEFENSKNINLVKDLESVEKFIKKILVSEVLGEALGDVEVLSYNLDQIKEVSHNPNKYFKRGHLFDISKKEDVIVLKLNELRTYSRETEISAIEAFVKENGVIERKDLLTALNRMSSVIYIMMLKGAVGEYGNR